MPTDKKFGLIQQAESLMKSKSNVDTLFIDTLYLLTEEQSKEGFHKPSASVVREMTTYLGENGELESLEDYAQTVKNKYSNTALPLPLFMADLPFFKTPKGREQYLFTQYVDIECQKKAAKADGKSEKDIKPSLLINLFSKCGREIYDRVDKNMQKMRINMLPKRSGQVPIHHKF